MTAPPLTRRAVLAQAWPIILGQALVPLVGIVDAAVIGRNGDASALAGVALGATVVTLVFWAFGFLRMGVTGLTAQAAGACDQAETMAILVRAVALGLGSGLALLIASPLLAPAALALMAAPSGIAPTAHAFVVARFFGAPAALGCYAINGWLIGLGRTRMMLAVQLGMNLANILLDLMFVRLFGLGATGVGIGTALAEWCALGCGLWAAWAILREHGMEVTALLRRAGLFARAPMRRLLVVNRDIMVRTLALLALFTWFVHAGARQGAVPLAANHVLMQLVSLSAFVLDGFAFTAEARIGAAIGAGSRAAFGRAVRLTGEFTLGGGLVFTLLFWLTGPGFVAAITPDDAVRAAAAQVMPFCALVPLVGAPGWLLDGIFIGATRGRALRDAALIVIAAYLATDWMLSGHGNRGAWAALLASYAFRALSLAVFVPALVRAVEEPAAGVPRRSGA